MPQMSPLKTLEVKAFRALPVKFWILEFICTDKMQPNHLKTNLLCRSFHTGLFKGIIFLFRRRYLWQLIGRFKTAESIHVCGCKATFSLELSFYDITQPNALVGALVVTNGFERWMNSYLCGIWLEHIVEHLQNQFRQFVNASAFCICLSG